MKGFKIIDELSLDECNKMLKTESDQHIIDAIKLHIERLEEEKKKQDEKCFKKCKSIIDYQNYLKLFPAGIHASEVPDIVSKLESKSEEDTYKSCQTIGQYQDYIMKYPRGRYVKNATEKIDDLFFEENKRSKRKCEKYLSKYPGGRHVNQAKECIEKSVRNRWLFIIVIIIIIIICIIGYKPSGDIVFSKTNDYKSTLSRFKVSLVTTSGPSLPFLSFPFVAAPQESSSKTISFKKEGGTQEVSFSVNSSSENIELNTYEKWIKIKKNTSGKISITVTRNEGDKRQGKVEVKTYSSFFGVRMGSNTGVIYVNQESGYASYINTGTSSLSYDKLAGSKTISVSSDGFWSISRMPSSSWCHLLNNNNSITIRVDSNSGEDRSDYLILASGGLTKRIDISQSGIPATYLRIDESELLVDKEGKRYTAYYYTDGKTVKVYTNSDWITVSQDKTMQSISIKTQTNTGNRRRGVVHVEASGYEESIEVIQKGKTSSLSLNYETWTFDTSSDYNYFTIYSDGDDPITASTSYGWITCSVTSGSLRVSVIGNSGSARSGTVYVKSGTGMTSITIKQKGYHNCSRCFNGFYSTGSIYGIIGYYYIGYQQVAQYGSTICPDCLGTGKIKDQ